MFTLVLLEDTVRIPPEEFDDEASAIHYHINEKYTNKVIDRVGLCLELYDIQTISQGTVYQGQGGAYTHVTFRMIVFHPKMDEVLVGSIKECTPDGLQISLDFFDQVYIPASALPVPSSWDQDSKIWGWEFEASDSVRITLFSSP